MRNFVSHLESCIDGTRFEFGEVLTTHQDRPIRVDYDLKKIRRAVRRDELLQRPPDMWRYRELLPTADPVVSLGEVMTPLLPCPRVAADVGLRKLYVKDESRLPTGSFKARGMAVAITMAVGLRIGRVAVASAGNAAGAAAAYAARAGIECFVFMPSDAPQVNRAEAALFGARVALVDGLISDCGTVVREGVERKGWFDLGALREPYRLEGKKTMGFELAEQLGWKLPDAIFYPTGGGTGLIGMWKAFQELAHLDWLESAKPPRLFACQAAGCAPLAAAFRNEERFARAPENPHTVASGLRVPKPIGDFLILDAVRASGGQVLEATDEQLLHWMDRGAMLEGVSLCPEAAACLSCLGEAVASGMVGPDETVVIFNTAAVQKYVEVMPKELPRLQPGAVDWDQI